MKRHRTSSPSEICSADLREWPERLVGGKYVRLLEKYVQSLRDEDSHTKEHAGLVDGNDGMPGLDTDLGQRVIGPHQPGVVH